MVAVPKAAEPLVAVLSIAFTRPTFQRVVILIFGAILSLRRRGFCHPPHHRVIEAGRESFRRAIRNSQTRRQECGGGEREGALAEPRSSVTDTGCTGRWPRNPHP